MVYLELQGGKERGLDLAPVKAASVVVEGVVAGGYAPRPRPLASRATEDELAAHQAFIAKVLKDKALWLKL
jgi:DNA polymerase-3 subunit epsilon